MTTTSTDPSEELYTRRKPLERVDGLTLARFKEEFLLKKPVVFTEPAGTWRPDETLTKEVLLRRAPEATVKIRPRRRGYLAAERITQYVSLREYYERLDAWNRDVEAGTVAGDEYPPYLHDTPLLKNSPALAQMLKDFPKGYLPSWYGSSWPRFCLFFIGTTKGTTPLHFDSCETSNLFFQVSGRKRWIIIPSNPRLDRFRVNWQWSTINAEDPTQEQRRVLDSIDVREVVLGPRDILYLPPRTWHQVRLVETGISFNIDWHTARTAAESLVSVFRGSPLRNALTYNLPLLLGLTLGVPARALFPWLEMHLDYVD
jgi:hypothetical protein